MKKSFLLMMLLSGAGLIGKGAHAQVMEGGKALDLKEMGELYKSDLASVSFAMSPDAQAAASKVILEDLFLNSSRQKIWTKIFSEETISPRQVATQQDMLQLEMNRELLVAFFDYRANAQATRSNPKSVLSAEKLLVIMKKASVEIKKTILESLKTNSAYAQSTANIYLFKFAEASGKYNKFIDVRKQIYFISDQTMDLTSEMTEVSQILGLIEGQSANFDSKQMAKVTSAVSKTVFPQAKKIQQLLKTYNSQVSELISNWKNTSSVARYPDFTPLTLTISTGDLNGLKIAMNQLYEEVSKFQNHLSMNEMQLREQVAELYLNDMISKLNSETH